jgi:hypothetical protein
MRKLLVASALLVAFSASPGMARDYAWCSRTPVNDGNPQCDFDTVQQCMATVSGQGGDCIQNPRLAFGQMPVGRRARSGGRPNNGWDDRRW